LWGSTTKIFFNRSFVSAEKNFRKVSKAEYSFPKFFSAETKDLLKKILVVDPHKRLTLAQIKNEPWYLKYNTEEQVIVPPNIELSHQHLDTEFEEHEYIKTNDEYAEKHQGPIGLNAFELISLCGGMDLNLMFESGPQVKRSTRFTSSQKPEFILHSVSAALKEMEIDHKTFADSFKIKARFNTELKGRMTFTVQIICMVTGLYIVEVRRGKGDGLEFYSVYKELVKKLGSVVETGAEGLWATDAVDPNAANEGTATA
jgi:serine/threonine protein kinase